MTTDLHAERAQRRRADRRTQRQRARWVNWLVVATSAIGAVFCSAHPTGHAVVDGVEQALFAGLVAAAAGRARRAPVVVLAALALGFSRGWWIVPAALGLVIAFLATFEERRRRRINTVVGALAVQSLLRLHPVGFHGSTALVAAVAVIPVLVSAYRVLAPRQRRACQWAAGFVVVVAVLGTVPAAVAALAGRGRTSAGLANTRIAFDAASNGSQSGAIANLDQAASQFASAHRTLGSPLTALAGLVPVVSQHRKALAEGTSLAATVARSAATSARSADYDQLRYQAGRIDTARLAAMEAPLNTLVGTLDAAQRRAGDLDSSWLLSPVDHRLRSLTDQIDRALPDAELASQAAELGPALLGGDGVRRYFVAFMTPAEQRGLGGYVGAWGELVADHGHLELARAGPSATLKRAAPNGARHLIGLTGNQQQWGSFLPTDSPSDATFSPDFPSVAQALAQLYPQSGGQPVDGVLALDPYALAALLRFTGPIRVAGLNQPLTPANAAAFLTYQQYLLYPDLGLPQAARHDAQQDALEAAFERLTAGSLPGPRALADTLSPAAHQGRLLVWSRNADEEALMRRLGVAGDMPRPGGHDLLAVTTQNEGRNKVDVFLHRRIDYRVQVDPPSGQITATATVTLTNDAPASGLPESITGRSFDLPPGTNATYLSLYTPLLADRVDVDGQPAPIRGGLEAGSHVYSLSVRIPPGSSRTVVFRLNGRLASSHGYGLVVRPQPSVNADQLDVQVTAAGGRRLAVAAPWAPTADGATYRADLTTTENLGLGMTGTSR